MLHQDIQIYKERIEKEYYDLLNHRDGILSEIELQESKLKELRVGNLKIYNEMEAKILEANQEVLKIKKEKIDFIKDLKKREDNITIDLKGLTTKEMI